MSHPTPAHRPIPAVPLVAAFFAAVIILGVLTAIAPVLAAVMALAIAATLIVAYLRGWSIR